MFADHSWRPGHSHGAQRPNRQADTSVDGPAGIPTVVIGVDGSSSSWDAFCWGSGEARRMGGRVVAVFTSPGAAVPETTKTTETTETTEASAPVLESDSAMLDDAAALADGTEAERLAAEIRREADDLGIGLSFIHARGNPAIELLRIAKVVGADLIVVGKSAKPRHRLIGSVGQRLIRRHAAPVVVVVP